MFAKKTVSTITHGLTKMVADLRALSAAKDEEVLELTKKINELANQQDVASEEGLKATSVADKIEALLS